MAAQLRDEFGNPIQLTDEFGNPVQLTDEHGVPVHVTGIATKERPTVETIIRGDVVEETGLLSSTTAGTGGDALKGPEPSIEAAQGELKTDVRDESAGEIQRSSSSSSVSSEDDGEGGRRNKKGLRQKLKERLNIGKHKEAEHGSTAAGGGGAEQQQVYEQSHEKKSVIEKIKEKLPGHHSH